MTSDDLIHNPPKYEGYIVGSDQTWNPYTAYNSDAFYLTFVKNSNMKGSYGPSLGISFLTKKQENRIRRLLSDFRFLSCRELQGAKILENVLNRQVIKVVDPTLLIDTNEWESIANYATLEITDRYILEYFLGDNPLHRIFVKRLSRMTGYKIVSLPFSYLDMDDVEVDKQFVGPLNFIKLIQHAEYVCTDSFHGTAFSVNFNKQFYAFCKMDDSNKQSENSRLYSLINEFQLSDRLINNCLDYDFKITSIDYQKVNILLRKNVEISKKYLESMINSFLKGE